ncbi:MAG: hypothetical protein ACQEP1_06745 [Nanobdellota archaeon]
MEEKQPDIGSVGAMLDESNEIKGFYNEFNNETYSVPNTGSSGAVMQEGKENQSLFYRLNNISENKPGGPPDMPVNGTGKKYGTMGETRREINEGRGLFNILNKVKENYTSPGKVNMKYAL